MLPHTPLIAFTPPKDTTRARRFYEEILGLRFVSDDSFAIVMDANGTMVRIVRVEDFTPFPFTILGWQVNDIHKIIAEMTGKGVEFTPSPYFEQSPAGASSPPAAAPVPRLTDATRNTL